MTIGIPSITASKKLLLEEPCETRTGLIISNLNCDIFIFEDSRTKSIQVFSDEAIKNLRHKNEYGIITLFKSRAGRKPSKETIQPDLLIVVPKNAIFSLSAELMRGFKLTALQHINSVTLISSTGGGASLSTVDLLTVKTHGGKTSIDFDRTSQIFCDPISGKNTVCTISFKQADRATITAQGGATVLTSGDLRQYVGMQDPHKRGLIHEGKIKDGMPIVTPEGSLRLSAATY